MVQPTKMAYHNLCVLPRLFFVRFPVAVCLANLRFFPAGAYSPAIPQLRQSFGISTEVAYLGISIYPLGFLVGGIFAAPLSELYGRRPIYLILWLVVIVLLNGCALATNVSTFIIFRWLCAFMASGPFAVVGGTIADLWDAHERAVPIVLFSAMSTASLSLGPVIGGIVAQYTTW